MWWRERSLQARGPVLRLLAVIAAAGLTAGCWQPLYGSSPVPGAEGVQDKFAAIEVAPIHAAKGTPAERVAIGVFNALQYDLHNGGSGAPPVYRLAADIGSSVWTAVVDPTSGRPDAQITNVAVNFHLIEIATGKVVVTDSAYAHVSYDVPGPEQRFASQRAQRNAEDNAMVIAAGMVRNRLASYFVAGT